MSKDKRTTIPEVVSSFANNIKSGAKKIGGAFAEAVNPKSIARDTVNGLNNMANLLPGQPQEPEYGPQAVTGNYTNYNADVDRVIKELVALVPSFRHSCPTHDMFAAGQDDESIRANVAKKQYLQKFEQLIALDKQVPGALQKGVDALKKAGVIFNINPNANLEQQLVNSTGNVNAKYDDYYTNKMSRSTTDADTLNSNAMSALDKYGSFADMEAAINALQQNDWQKYEDIRNDIITIAAADSGIQVTHNAGNTRGLTVTGNSANAKALKHAAELLNKKVTGWDTDNAALYNKYKGDYNNLYIDNKLNYSDINDAKTRARQQLALKSNINRMITELSSYCARYRIPMDGSVDVDNTNLPDSVKKQLNDLQASISKQDNDLFMLQQDTAKRNKDPNFKKVFTEEFVNNWIAQQFVSQEEKNQLLEVLAEVKGNTVGADNSGIKQHINERMQVQR